MKQGLYFRLALTNLGKNRRIYIPHIIAGIGLSATFFVFSALAFDEKVSEGYRGPDIVRIMLVGTMIMALLSVVLSLYTNSFLIKQRKREFGLYNILGMEKRHVGSILFYESFISAVISITGGVLLGMLFYKLALLLLCKLIKVDSPLGADIVSFTAVLPTVLLFVVLNLVAFLYDLIQIAKLRPVQLLDKSGEREPKVKWPIFVIGMAALLGGYYLAIATENPIKALVIFFLAVILVIIGTYALFTAGSIAVLKMLKNNKSFYYNSRRMIPISGMLYRMKQNAVGLASICVLSTGVIIMVASTASMYAEIEETTAIQYPHQIEASAYDEEGEIIPASDLENYITDNVRQLGADVSYSGTLKYYESILFKEDGELKNEPAEFSYSNLNNVVQCVFISSKDYENNTGKRADLDSGEILLFPGRKKSFGGSDSITLLGKTYKIKEMLTEYPTPMNEAIGSALGFVVKDESDVDEIFRKAKEEGVEGDYNNGFCEKVYIDLTKDVDYAVFDYNINNIIRLNYPEGTMFDMAVRSEEKKSYCEFLGGFLFLGAMLSLVFMFATALIIYYKQLSEGLEDRDRFQIMQKVGMTDEEVHKTIKSQIRMVFFLPIAMAGIHVIVASFILNRLLGKIFLVSEALFIGCTVFTYLAFVLIYTLIYIRTSKIYYRIVR